MKKETFDVTGMTCSSCSSRVEKAVGGLRGVANVSVNLLKNSMNVTFDENIVASPDIISVVERSGYGAALKNSSSSLGSSKNSLKNPTIDELQEMKHRLLLSLTFTIPLFYISMGSMFGLPLPLFLTGDANLLAFALTQFLLTIPVVMVNSKYYKVGFKALFSGAPTMDSLIAIGSGAAVVFGVYSLYKMAFYIGVGDVGAVHSFAMNLYFESAAMILTLITLGKYFETRAKGKTSDAIAKLMDLAPKTARVIRNDVEMIVPRDTVIVGDITIVKAGESVPVDGVIIEGNGFLDESAITGESLPRDKKSGDLVTGATINTSGHFLMRTTRVGDDTTLAQIIKLVDEATSSKAPIARMADKISGVFVPIVILIAFIATGVWLFLGYGVEFSLSIGIAVLVISCPCALGLATPTAIMVGTGRGAANGILFKSAESIEKTRLIDTVILDKTGTVTEGRPVVTNIITAPGKSEKELLQLASSLEKLSEHPLAIPIVNEAKKQGIITKNVSMFTQVSGQGIHGVIDGERCFAGNLKMLLAEGINVKEIPQMGEHLSEEGKTVLYFVKGNSLLGLIAVADTIKPTSKQAVSEFADMGIHVIMITGDNEKTASFIKKQAGIELVIADVMPQDKEKEVIALQDQGKTVAMVGDGINDAPALARADVGIAIGAGTDVAIESADIVLMKSDLLDAVTAIELSRAVMRNIKQNLFWAFFYNIVGIPVAAGVFYSTWGITLNPMIAAAAMSLSSVCVVSNALRLRFFVPKHRGAVGTTNNQEKNDPKMINITNKERELVMKKIISIEGMSCGHCTSSVEKALKLVDGVSGVSVSLENKSATVAGERQVTDDILRKAIIDAGFTVTGIE